MQVSLPDKWKLNGIRDVRTLTVVKFLGTLFLRILYNDVLGLNLDDLTSDHIASCHVCL